MRAFLLSVIAVLLAGSSVWANPVDSSLGLFPARPGHDPWQVNWLASGGQDGPSVPVRALVYPPLPPQQGDAQPLHAVAVEHSDAYQTRAKIHKIASFATLPLFATELALGQSIYNTPSNGKKSAHIFVGTSLIALFGVNTVTGAWNLFGEGWQDKQGRTLRLVHGLLMMASNAGFVATAATGPNSRSRTGSLNFAANEQTHRNIAVASIGIGTVGYLLMLFGNH